jgi:geranylgeranyl reductase family protein
MNPNNNFDAIVIGAGPAGSTAAYLLASKGFKVLILDKKDFPRDKLCGGLLTWKTIRLIESVFQKSVDFLNSQKIVANQSFHYSFQTKGRNSIKGKMEYPFYFVDRRFYDFYWLKMAQEAGAKFTSDEKVISLDPTKKEITTNKGFKYYGKFIFGADGALSKIRKLLFQTGFMKSESNPELATALEISIPSLPSYSLPDYPSIFFGYIPWGYAWCFPQKHQRVIGMCGLNSKSGRILRKSFNQFLNSLCISKLDMPEPGSHPLPYGNYLTNPGYGNIMLIGDACGLADPLLGEGIYYAHRSSQLAVMAALQSYKNPQVATKTYTNYLVQDILNELDFIRTARQIIFSLPGKLPFKIIETLLKTMPKKCEEAVHGQRSFKWLRPIHRRFKFPN